MLKRLARNPSMASETPAITKIANAISIWLETIAQTMTGTRMMRPSVMMFGMLVGILNSVASRLPACFYWISGPVGGGPIVIYIVYARPACEPLQDGGLGAVSTSVTEGPGEGQSSKVRRGPSP